MDIKFMESCWWVFKQLFDTGDVYRAYQIMPYSTALCTPLSQMEAKQNEKITQDPAILVSFPVLGVEGKEDTLSSTPPRPGPWLRTSSSPSTPTLSTWRFSTRIPAGGTSC
jgi:hypothetical protein